MTLEIPLEEGRDEKEIFESEFRNSKMIRKYRNMVVEERRSETASDRGGNLQQQ